MSKLWFKQRMFDKMNRHPLVGTAYFKKEKLFNTQIAYKIQDGGNPTSGPYFLITDRTFKSKFQFYRDI